MLFCYDYAIRNTSKVFIKIKSQKYLVVLLALITHLPLSINSEKISKRKVPNQMAKSNDKAHQRKGQQLSYS